jgi:hypothetical protein
MMVAGTLQAVATPDLTTPFPGRFRERLSQRTHVSRS